MKSTLSDLHLRSLIARRLEADADKGVIDAEIWDRFGEEWCVMATDLAGFSRGVAEFGIIHFLQTISESERLLVPVIEQAGGTLLKVEGDSFLVIFRDVDAALRAAMEMQSVTRVYNRTRTPAEQVLVGIGLGFGRVLRIAESEVFGNEVNSACILGETYANRHEILVTDAVRRRAPADLQFEPFTPAPPGAGAAWRLVFGE